jgi:hypothetical protein
MKILGFDIDGTLLSRGEIFGKKKRSTAILDQLLSILRTNSDVEICFITGNDYENTQEKRVATPIINAIPASDRPSLLPRILIYADGATRKFSIDTTFSKFTECDSYRNGPPRTYFKPPESDDLVRIVQEEVNSLIATNRVDPFRLQYPNINYKPIPSQNDPLSITDLVLTLSPINVNPEALGMPGIRTAEAFCQPGSDARTLFADRFKIFPEFTLKKEDSMIEIIIRQFADPIQHKQKAEIAEIVIALYDLFPSYSLSVPSVQLRGSNIPGKGFLVTQIAVKPIKNDELRRGLIDSINARATNAFANKGGSTTVDIQRSVIISGRRWIANKTCAIRNILDNNQDCVLSYFGDEFSLDGNDRCIAEMPEAKTGIITCFTVGKTPSNIDTVWDSGGGPDTSLSLLKFANFLRVNFYE